jgi:protein-S-isoprenylcysteine O-methyltransferase Ste14
MFPILVFMYARLAKSEEADMLAQFGEQYRRYMQSVPAFVPKLGHRSIMKGDFT